MYGPGGITVTDRQTFFEKRGDNILDIPAENPI